MESAGCLIREENEAARSRNKGRMECLTQLFQLFSILGSVAHVGDCPVVPWRKAFFLAVF